MDTNIDLDMTAQQELDEASRQRLAAFADQMIPGGAGLPSASTANVHTKWIDRTLAVRPDLAETVRAVIARPGDPAEELAQLQREDEHAFETFGYAVAGSYLMNPRVRKLLGYPGAAPKPNPAYPDEADFYLEDGILDVVIERGPIYRPTRPPPDPRAHTRS